MKTKICIILLVLGALIPISVNAYAHEPNRISEGISTMGGSGGHGMMGGMSGLGALLLDIWKELSGKVAGPELQDDREIKILRQEIRAKTLEIDSLYKAPHRDRALVDQKVAELLRLESELENRTNYLGRERGH